MSHTPTARVAPICAFVATLLAGTRAVAVAEDARPLPSRITAVTVHLKDATVTREAMADLTPGEHRFLIRPLPSGLDPRSVRVRGRGTPGLVIRGVEVRLVHEETGSTKEAGALEDEIRGLTRRHTLALERKKSIGSLREFVTGLKAAAIETSSHDLLAHGFATADWERAFAFVSGHLDALAGEEQRVEREYGELSTSLETARARLAETASRRASEHFAAEILLSAKDGGSARLSLTYLVSGAAWSPLYDARLDSALSKVTLDALGQIVQTTGEDWDQVEVTLTTAQPLAGIDLPRLASVRLVDPARRNVQGGFVSVVDGSSYSSEFIDSLPILGKNYQDILALPQGISGPGAGAPAIIHGARDTEVVQLSAETVRTDVTMVLALPGRLDIPSDGQPHQHLIASRDLGAAVEYHCVPALSPDVFVAARLTLPDDLPLLPAQMAHFVDGDLVGHSTVGPRSGGEELTLSFGPEMRLRTERRETLLKIGRRGRDEERDRQVVTTLRNYLGRAVTVHVSDRVPVSGDDRIDVGIDRDDTTTALPSDPREPGILRWNLPVPAAGRADVTLRYTIRAPAGMLPAEQ